MSNSMRLTARAILEANRAVAESSGYKRVATATATVEAEGALSVRFNSPFTLGPGDELLYIPLDATEQHIEVWLRPGRAGPSDEPAPGAVEAIEVWQELPRWRRIWEWMRP